MGLDDPGDQRGDKDGGHAAARGGQPQSQAPPVPEPVAHRQGEGDHAAVAVGQTGEGPRGTVEGETVGQAEAEAGQGQQHYPQGHHQTQSDPGAQLIHCQHGGQGEEAARGGDPGALGVGKAVELDDVGLIHGEHVDAHPHDREQGQGAAQTDDPGVMGPPKGDHGNSTSLFLSPTIQEAGTFVKGDFTGGAGRREENWRR